MKRRILVDSLTDHEMKGMSSCDFRSLDSIVLVRATGEFRTPNESYRKHFIPAGSERKSRLTTRDEPFWTLLRGRRRSADVTAICRLNSTIPTGRKLPEFNVKLWTAATSSP